MPTIITVDGPGGPVPAVESLDSRLTDLERRQEAAQPFARLSNCRCGEPLLSEPDARRIRRMAEAVRALFPRQTPAGRKDGRPVCRACSRTRPEAEPPCR